jgi:hypothetical protein
MPVTGSSCPGALVAYSPERDNAASPRKSKIVTTRRVARCPVQSNQLKDHAASESAVVRTTAILTYEKVATACVNTRSGSRFLCGVRGW